MLRWSWVVVLLGCRLGDPDPVQFLDFYGYTLVPPGMSEIPMPTIGPYVCPSGNRAFTATATRKPVPEENPCMRIRAEVIICCPTGGSRCYGHEKDSRCDSDGSERATSEPGGH